MLWYVVCMCALVVASQAEEATFLGKDQAEEFKELKPEKSKEKLGELFSKVDAVGTVDGFVDKEELTKWIDDQQNDYNDGRVNQQFVQIDKNKDESITWQEYTEHNFPFLGETATEEDKRKLTNDDRLYWEGQQKRDKRRFRRADLDQDEKLTAAEFGGVIKPERYSHMHDLYVKEAVFEFDQNGDGKITLEEYVGDTVSLLPHREKMAYMEDQNKRFEKEQDTNKDGWMDESEVRAWLIPDTQKKITDEVAHLLKESDVDQDGKISKEEMLNKYELFVGSQAAVYTDMFQGHDEL